MPRQIIAINIENGKIHAPNTADNGNVINISSNGVNTDNPITSNIVPSIILKVSPTGL